MLRASKTTRAILASVSVSALLIAAPVVLPVTAPAAAQTSVAVSVEFRTALTPYGSWRTVPRWGEVWVPARLTRDWQPYTVGHWVYSDDYGWYWISDDQEAEWGWIAFHYGRWINVDAYGWVWVPGNEWGPAWVDWRRGDAYAGWAPLPPDEVIVEYRQRPNFWIFVRTADLISPRLRTAFLPLSQRQAILQRTVVVNRTVVLNDRRFAVNPGIAPAIVAAAARQPVRTFEVRPQIVAGTANIQGAIEIRADDLRRGGNRPGQSVVRGSVVRQTANSVQPAQNVPSPQALGSGENGRLGDNPPRAAASRQERGTTGAAPTNQGAAPPSAIPQQQPRQGAAPTERGNQPPATSGQAPPNAVPPNQRREGRPEQQSQQPPRQDVAPAERGHQPPSTSGQAPPNAGAPNQRREGPQQQQPQPPRQGAAPPATSGQAPPAQHPERPPARDDRNAR